VVAPAAGAQRHGDANRGENIFVSQHRCLLSASDARCDAASCVQQFLASAQHKPIPTKLETIPFYDVVNVSRKLRDDCMRSRGGAATPSAETAAPTLPEH
jgi:hypothetical protein